MKILENTLINFADTIQKTRTINLLEFMNSMENAFKQAGFRDERNAGAIKNILVTRLDAIGDNVLNSGFLRELRRNNPSAHITLIVNPVVYNLVELCPYVNEVFAIPNSGNLLLWLNNAFNLCRAKLWDRHYDLYLNPRWDVDYYFALLLGFLSGAKERIGYSTKLFPLKEERNAGYDLFLTKTVMTPQNVVHESDRNLFFLKALGMTVQDTKNELWYDYKDVLRGDALLAEAGYTPTGGGVLQRLSLFATEQMLRLVFIRRKCCYRR